MYEAMMFPDTVEEFMDQYKMIDTDGVYSNGTEYVPIFRMKQWFEHLPNIEDDFRKYISDQVNKTSGVYACRYCKNREAFDEDYGCGCDHADCDGVNEWEYGTPRKENE